MALIEIDALPQPADIDTGAVTRDLSLAPGNVFVTVQPVEFVEPGG